MKFLKILFLIFFVSSEAYAGNEQKIKRSLINNFTDNLSNAVQNFLDGEGETKVQIDMGGRLQT